MNPIDDSNTDADLHPRILIIAEDKLPYAAFQDRLSTTCAVFAVPSADTAFQLLQEMDFQIVIGSAEHSDMISGEFLRRLKQNYPQITRVLITSEPNIAELAPSINESDFFRYIAHTSEPEELEELVKDIRDRLFSIGSSTITDKTTFQTDAESFYKSLFENTRELVVASGPDSRVIVVNPATIEQLGYSSQDEILGTLAETLYANPTERKQLIADLMVDGFVQSREFILKKKDGTPLPVIGTAQAYSDDYGNIHHVEAIYTNNSSRAEMEKRLLESEERLSLALEAGGHALWDWDLEANEVVRNSTWYELLGYAPGEIGAQQDLRESLVHPEDIRRLRQSIQAHIASETPFFDSEYRIRTKSGSWLWVHDHGKIVRRDEHGKPLRLIGTFHDLTKRKRLEADLRQNIAEMTLLNQMVAKTASTLDMDTVVSDGLETILRIMTSDLALIFLKDADELRLHAIQASEPRFEPEYLPVHEVGQCLCGIAAKTEESIFAKNIHSDTRCTWNECKIAGLRSFAAIPLRDQEGVWGLLGLASEVEYDYESRRRFLETLALQYGSALKNAFLHEQLRHQRAELEGTVRERTAQLIHANKELQTENLIRQHLQQELIKSEHLLKAVLDHIPLSVFWKDLDSVYMGCNQLCASNAGLTAPTEIVGKTDFDLSWKARAAEYRAADRAVVKAQKPLLGIEDSSVTDSGERWGIYNRLPLYDDQGKIIGILGTYQDITQRKISEIALQETQEQMSSILGSMDDLLFALDRNGVFTDYYHTNTAHGLYVLPDDFLGEHYQDILPPTVSKRVDSALARLRLTGAVQDFEYGLVIDDHEEWFHGKISPLKNAKQEEIGCLAAVRNITARKHLETTLHESQERYRALSELTSDFAFGLHIGPDGGARLDWITGAVTRILGYSESELRAMPDLREIVNVNELARVTRLISVAQSGLESAAELQCLAKSGKPCWLLVHLKPLETDKQDRAAHLLGAAKDVTEQRLAEKVIEESEERFRRLIEASPEAITLVDLKGQLILVNERMLEIHGFESEPDLRSSIANSTELVVPEFREQLIETMRRIMRTQEHEAVELELLRKDGSQFPAEIQLASITDGTGLPMSILGISRDITERRNIALREHNIAQEQAAERERQRLARDLHDSVSQTLFSANLTAEMMLRAWDNANPEQVKITLEHLLQLTRAAQAEMRNLLLELRPKTLFESSLADLVDQLAIAASNRSGIDISVEANSNEILPAEIHVTLYRICQEALNNIIKHADADHVTIKLMMFASHINLHIIDNGHGFDTKYIPKDRLGLKIMRERALSIGAKLDIASIPDGGTEVVVHFLKPNGSR